MKFGLMRRGPFGLSRWDPFEEIKQTQEHLNQLFREIPPFGGWLEGKSIAQTKLRTYEIVPNTNISFPIGTILTVEKLYDALDFLTVFGKHKKHGIDINRLLKALVSYKLTDNFSIKKAHEWINREEVLELFDLDTFSERTLYRVLENIGSNREEIISDIQDNLFKRYDFEHTNINMDWTSVVLHGDKAPLGNRVKSKI
jgi:hypothetical protein